MSGFGACTCGHGRSAHNQQFDLMRGYVTYCLKCRRCSRNSNDHVFVNHQFDRCPCNSFQETE